MIRLFWISWQSYELSSAYAFIQKLNYFFSYFCPICRESSLFIRTSLADYRQILQADYLTHQTSQLALECPKTVALVTSHCHNSLLWLEGWDSLSRTRIHPIQNRHFQKGWLHLSSTLLYLPFENSNLMLAQKSSLHLAQQMTMSCIPYGSRTMASSEE